MRPRDGERFIARAIARGNISLALCVERELFAALKAGEIREEAIAKKPLAFGLRLANQPAKTREDVPAIKPASSHGKRKRLKRLANLTCEDRREDAAKTRRRPRKSLKNNAKTLCEDASTTSVAGSRRRAGARRAAPALLLYRRGLPIAFGEPFERGDVLMDRGQRFICVEVIPCIRKNGESSTWTVWRGECANPSCHASFNVNAYSKTWRSVQRRCDLHKSPLSKTKFGRRGSSRKSRSAI
jgi:hypothetical protein